MLILYIDDLDLEIQKVCFSLLSGSQKHLKAHPPSKSQEYVSSHFQQIQVLAGTSFQIPKNVEEFYHFLVFSTLFGESMSSRLFQSVREQAGLCYSIQGMRTFFSSTALWNIYANTSPQLLNKLLQAFNEEIRKIKNKPIRKKINQ